MDWLVSQKLIFRYIKMVTTAGSGNKVSKRKNKQENQ